MIIIDQRKLRFLRTGRSIHITTPRPYRVNRAYPAGHRPKHSVCRVLILRCDELGKGQYELEIRQLRQERPIYLAASPSAQRADYTANPAKAARGTDGSAIEAAADRETLNRYAKEAYERWDQLRRDRVASRPVSRRHRYAP